MTKKKNLDKTQKFQKSCKIIFFTDYKLVQIERKK